MPIDQNNQIPPGGHDEQWWLKRLAMVAERTENAVVLTDADKRIEWANAGFTRITGYTLEEARGRNPGDVLQGPETDPQTIRHIRECLQAGRGFQVEVLNYHKSGSTYWIALDVRPVHDERGAITGWMGVQTDLSAARRREEALRLMTEIDPLTGLGNRVGLMRHMKEMLERGRPFAAAYIDLDRFKVVNDSLSHAAGDRLLCVVGGRLRELVMSLLRQGRIGPASRAVRMSGDEFVLVLEGAGETTAGEVGQWVMRRLSEPCVIEGHEVHLSASCGLVLAGPGHADAHAVLREADIALGDAKRSGSGRCVSYDTRLHAAVRDRLSLESDLRRAIERDGIEVHYQPLIDLSTGRLSGFEALARWSHPERGMVSPMVFVPIAEETGLICELGRRVLERATEQLSVWRKTLPTCRTARMSVNLSRRQLRDPELHRLVEQTVRRAGLPTEAVNLEITESVVVEQPAQTLALLHRLREAGVGLQLDDFGTGLSSLSCLHQLPLVGLKIDRAFVQSMDQRREYTAVVHAIIELAHNLGMGVTAEGIETPGQMVQLQALEADVGQGYLFGKPMPADRVAPWLDAFDASRFIGGESAQAASAARSAG